MAQQHLFLEQLRRKEMVPQNPPLPPDGGAVAWFQVAGSFFLYMNGWGIINTYGVFQAYYEQDLLRHQSSSNISWIGSIQACLLIFGGLVTGPLCDRGRVRDLVCTGSFLVVFGMMMTSLCKQYWQFVLAQGIVVGLGNSCLFVPSVVIITTYFAKKRALANGVAISGSSVGGILYPIIFHKLQPRIGFGWTVRTMAFIMLATLSVPILGMKMRGMPPKARKMFDAKAWTEPPYALYAVGLFFAFLGLYIPFFYVQLYALKKGIVSQDLVFYLLPLLNAGSFFGRLIPNFIADFTGPLNLGAPLSAGAVVLAFAWIGIKNQGGIIVFCLLYGFLSAPYVALAPSVVASLCPTLAMLGVRTGMLFGPIAVGLLIGNPIAGSLLDNSWVALQAFCGAALIVATCTIVATRVAKVGIGLKIKV